MEDPGRLTRIEDKLDREIEVAATFRGRLEQYMKGQSEYIDAVGDKVRKIEAALQAHKDDNRAHGLGDQKDAKTAFDSKVMGWAGVGAAALATFGGVIGAWAHKLWSHQ
jgi:hypothetical protein